jgi:cytochrome bd ubiquinol oxidase subunit II
MSSADACAAILWLGVTLYALFGGADFGAGIWDLLARNETGRDGARPRISADRVRAQIDRSIGPVWEANHVWLIFVLVVLWTAFAEAFSAIMTTLYIPLSLAALGIVLRGAGFAFRHALPGAVQRPASRVFGVASLLTPFFMGTVVGAIASGKVPAGGDGDPTASWTGTMPLVAGLLFVLVASYTAAVFLVRDSGAAGDLELRDYFARRALVAAVIAGAAAVVGLIALHADGRYVYDGLTSWPGIALVILSGICGLVALGLLVTGRSYGLRVAAVGAGTAVVWGYFAAAFPYVLPTSLSISDAAGASGTLTAVIVIFAAAAVTVVPSLALLYMLSQRQALEGYSATSDVKGPRDI